MQTDQYPYAPPEPDSDTGQASQLPFPGPNPLPVPLPFPWPPVDWWRCLRLRPVSGRYQGAMTSPFPGRSSLDLRVDIDPRHANSPVMDRVSGDFYRSFHFVLPGGRPLFWRVYQESWIVDRPEVSWSRCQVVITGTVRFWKGVHPATDIRIEIPWTLGSIGPAAVTFTETGGLGSSYTCAKTSEAFRDLMLEVDVCQSVNLAPLLPSYDTHAHTIRPLGLSQRALTIENCYDEAGIKLTFNPSSNVIDDSAAEFNTWSPAELHDAMEQHFSQIGGSWPNWHMWGLMAGTFDNSSVGGIMFDAAAMYGGAGEAPERQGFAVFRNHSWFNNLPAGAPATQDEAWALRHFLYTYVHEAGHAFNFLHSWNKSRPDSLSWMNYDWRYDQRNGTDSFWSNFMFRFDDDELIHIRHGDRASVIMGGDPWASGGHLEEETGDMMAQLEGSAPIELLLRAQEYFDFLEPVTIEVRLRNLLPDIPLSLDTRLSPEFGGVIFYIQRPDGHVVQYDPVMCKLGTPEIRTLLPAPLAVEGEDRYSENVTLTYGSGGFYFDEPGEYQIRAVYQGGGDILIPSNTLRLRVGRPFSKEEDRLAYDFFSFEVGMSLYVQGSQSPFLAKGMDVLNTVVERYKNTLLGAKAAAVIARSVGEPFFRIEERKGEHALVKSHRADPAEALRITQPFLTVYKKQTDPQLNIPYHQLVRHRAELMTAMGDQAEAKKEVAALRKDLANRGVNESVLETIKDFETSLTKK